MSIFNGNSLFLSKKSKTMPVVKVPKNVKQSLQIDRAFENGIFKIEPKEKMAVYDRCYIFEDINYINKNIGEQKDFLMDLMFWLNSMDVEFKITLANEYQSMEEFLESIRAEKNKAEYPDIAKGIRQWQDERIKETNPNVTTLRCSYNWSDHCNLSSNHCSGNNHFNAHRDYSFPDVFDSCDSRRWRKNRTDRFAGRK